MPMRATISGAGITESGSGPYSYAMTDTGTGYAVAQTGLTFGYVETVISGLSAGVAGGAYSIGVPTAAGGTQGASSTQSTYVRVAADHTLTVKVPNVAEAPVASSPVVVDGSRIAMIIYPDAWQKTITAVTVDGLDRVAQRCRRGA